MDPTPELIAALEREEVEEARRLPFAQRLLAGAELFDYACAIAEGSIRVQHPDWDDGRVRDELRRRMAIGDEVEGRA